MIKRIVLLAFLGLAMPVVVLAQWRPPATSTEPCGTTEPCEAVSYTATRTDGTAGFTCTGGTECIDLGPGACDTIGMNGSGYMVFGNGCSPALQVGDATLIQSGSINLQNGGLFLNGTTYIENLSGPVTITDAHGWVFNSGTAMDRVLFVPVVIDLALIGASSCNDVAVTVTGVADNDGVFITRNFASTADISVSDAYVTNGATDEVTFRACNSSVGGVDPASGQYLFWVVRKI